MAAYLQNFLQQFQHLKIQLQEIKSATNNFNVDNFIGVGGYGKVYKGELSHYMGRSMVAIKRLDKSNGQGTPEFLKEIMTLSRYSHENLISLLGFCYEEEEMILVYEHASRGSFDRYLTSPHLIWSQRIKICLGAAKGLGYLHDPGETHQRLIHCDIKSSNILLDEQWNAKVSDLGLSVMGSANEQHSVVVTLAAGTIGYIDPLYMMTHTLTKESDVYSFGVFLFEVLCGSLCYTYGNGRTQTTLVPMWIESYKQGKLSDIILKNPTIPSLDQITLKIVSDIGYQCLNLSREHRPLMTEVITELKTALETQEVSERMQVSDHEQMTRSAEPPLNYSSPYGLWKLLTKGVLVNDGKTWLSLNKKEEHCEMISIAECLDSATHEFSSADKSRFAVGPYFLSPGEKCKVCVKTQFLSPGITYTLTLVLRKTESLHLQWVSLKYKLEGETETSNSHLVCKSVDGYWWALELYQFTSDQRDHEIVFEFEADTGIEVEGIDFRPVEEVEQTDENQPISDSDANWEVKLPYDYEEMMKLSKHSLRWSTKKEAYSILRKGYLAIINGKDAWISLDNDGETRLLIPARTSLLIPARTSIQGTEDTEATIESSPESRFGEVAEFTSGTLFVGRSNDRGQCVLLYKLPEDLEIKDPVLVVDGENNQWYIYLVHPETPVIGPKADQNTRNRMSRSNIKVLPRQRDDGWMEIEIGDQRSVQPFQLDFPDTITELIIEGVELRKGLPRRRTFR